MKKILLSALAVLAFGAFAGELKCKFVEGGWNPDDWLNVKSPRWDYVGGFVQEKGYIRNLIPDVSDMVTAKKKSERIKQTQEILQGKKAPETFASMVLKNQVNGNAKISATMDFDYRMAPEIILSAPLGANKDGVAEYCEYWEIVLFDEGINVWHHELKNGKPFWRKAAFLNMEGKKDKNGNIPNGKMFKKNKKYTMDVEIIFTSKCPQVTVSCEGYKVGCMLPTFPKEYYVGITACEGINKFYDFKLVTPDAK